MESLTLYGIPLTALAQGGLSVVLLAFLVVIWRQLVATQTRFELVMQNRYEAVLERCITALVRVNDYLDDQKDHK